MACLRIPESNSAAASVRSKGRIHHTVQWSTHKEEVGEEEEEKEEEEEEEEEEKEEEEEEKEEEEEEEEEEDVDVDE